MMSKNTRKLELLWTTLLILVSSDTGCVSISAFTSLIGILVGIESASE